MKWSPILPVACSMLLLGSATQVAAQIRVDRNFSVESSGTASQSLQLYNVPVIPPQAAAAALPARPSGPTAAYSADAMGATIVAKNADYEMLFKMPGPVPAQASITNVAWKYSVSPQPYGFEAILCWQDQHNCWNVTRSASGSTTYFNGKSAAQPFTLHYRVNGSGPLGPPAQGSMNQIIVTYVLP